MQRRFFGTTENENLFVCCCSSCGRQRKLVELHVVRVVKRLSRVRIIVVVYRKNQIELSSGYCVSASLVGKKKRIVVLVGSCLII